MCGLHAYNKENDKSTYATDFGVRIPLPDDSKRVSLVYLCVSINFIYTWINVLAHNFAWRFCENQENTEEILKKIPT